MVYQTDLKADMVALITSDQPYWDTTGDTRMWNSSSPRGTATSTAVSPRCRGTADEPFPPVCRVADAAFKERP